MKSPKPLPAASAHPPETGSRLWRLLPLAGLGVALGAVWFSGLGEHLSFARLVERREWLSGLISSHYGLVLLGFVSIYIIVVALSIPGATVLTLAGGLLFGGWVGGALTVFAATAGAIALFLIARTALGALLAERAGPWLERLRAGFQEDAASYMLFLRLTPVFPFWLVNLAPALLGVKLWTFAWTTFAGLIPGTFAFAFAGAGLDSVIRAQQEAQRACLAAGHSPCEIAFSPSSLLTGELLAGLAAVGVAALIPVALRKWRGRSGLKSGNKQP